MIDIEGLFQRRLAVARFGEMDNARWWNSKGQLGRLGTTVFKRGFPHTHYFAQARAVFAVAAHRCDEVFDPPHAVTLWRLPEDIEQEFELRWEHWLNDPAQWTAFFSKLESLQSHDLIAVLRSLNIVSDRALELYGRLRRSAEGRAVPLPGEFSDDDDCVSLLALGFARGEIGSLAVPYIKLGDQ